MLQMPRPSSRQRRARIVRYDGSVAFRLSSCPRTPDPAERRTQARSSGGQIAGAAPKSNSQGKDKHPDPGSNSELRPAQTLAIGPRRQHHKRPQCGESQPTHAPAWRRRANQYQCTCHKHLRSFGSTAREVSDRRTRVRDASALRTRATCRSGVCPGDLGLARQVGATCQVSGVGKTALIAGYLRCGKAQ